VECQPPEAQSHRENLASVLRGNSRAWEKWGVRGRGMSLLLQK
jgi:hypothetical protein